VLVCDDGDCAIGACIGNFVDVNDDYRDGCEASCTFSGNEICDGLDNDCNGDIDDSATLPSQVCIPRRVGVRRGRHDRPARLPGDRDTVRRPRQRLRRHDR
jgi:hypothetical protein